MVSKKTTVSKGKTRVAASKEEQELARIRIPALLNMDATPFLILAQYGARAGHKGAENLSEAIVAFVSAYEAKKTPSPAEIVAYGHLAGALQAHREDVEGASWADLGKWGT